MGVSLLAMIALLMAAASFAGNADAAPAAGEDQYLEQVPSGGGVNRDANDDFSESVGDSDGVVTDDDVSDKAKANQQNQAGGPGANSPAPSTSNPPAAVQSVATAAKYGPFSQSQALIIGALVLVLGGSAVFMRVTA